MARPLTERKPRCSVPGLSSPTSHPAAARGAAAAVSAFVIWGVFPLYWKLLEGIDSGELVGHRIVWSLLLIVPLLFVSRAWGEFRAAWRQPGLIARHALSGLLLSANWFTYVWGVLHGHVLQTSLGYFLVPLFNVGLGVLVLHERLRPWQTAALGLAAAGVALQILRFGDVPWLALIIAFTWGFYSLLRKRSPLGSLAGLGVETLLLAPFAGGWLVWGAFHGGGALGHVGWLKDALILGTGVVTAVPLLLFAYAARRLRLSTVGLLQYIGPSIQFGLGVFVFHEAFAAERWAAFGCIWAALAVYSFDTVRAARAEAAGPANS